MNRHDQELSDEVVALINRLTTQARRRERRYAVAAALFGIIAVISAAGGWLAYEDSRNTSSLDEAAREDLELAVSALDELLSGISADLSALDAAPKEDVVRILQRAEERFSTFVAAADLAAPEYRLRHAELLVDLAAAYVRLDQPTRGVEAAASARALLADLPGDTAAAEADALMLEGDAHSALGDHSAATAAYGHAVELRTVLDQQAAGDRAMRHALSVALERQGQSLAARGDSEGAETILRQVVSLREELATGNSGDGGAQRALAVAYSNLGDLEAHTGALGEAIRLYEQAIATYDRLMAAGAGTDVMDALAEHYIRLGRVHTAADSPASALEALEKAEEIYAGLATEHPGTVRWRMRLADVLDERGAAEIARLDLPAARAELTRALDIRRLLADERQGDTAIMRDFAGTLLALAEVDRSEKLDEMARTRAAAALDLHRAVAAAEPANVEAVADLARALAAAAEFGIDRQANLQEAVDLLGGLQSRGSPADDQEELMADLRGRLNQTTQ